MWTWICVGNECSLLMYINACKPKSLPEWVSFPQFAILLILVFFYMDWHLRDLFRCRWFGPDSSVEIISRKWKRNCGKWYAEITSIWYVLFYCICALPPQFLFRNTNKPFNENLETLLEIELPRKISVSVSKDDEQLDCGICYAHCLPVGKALPFCLSGVSKSILYFFDWSTLIFW